MHHTQWSALGLLLWLPASIDAQPAGDLPSLARASNGQPITWREHIIDDAALAGFPLNGSDGLVMADLDQDGHHDIISVHEFDAGYDSANYTPGFAAPPDGHVRIAFGTGDPDRWINVTVAEGADAPAPEDVAVGDVNGDGWSDLVVAAELSHLIYLQNPGANARTAVWPRLILPMTRGTGSYIRVFLADFDGDGRLDVSAANKGAQIPGPADFAVSTPVSVFSAVGDPLLESGWQETVLGRYSVPQNAEPVDLDGDGDQDILVGTRGEDRLAWFENPGDGTLAFIEHAIGINGARLAGFNFAFADLNGDGRLDIIGASTGPQGPGLSWIAQPTRIDDAWNAHFIGTFMPDSMTGFAVADIDNDGDTDILAGSYSRGDREADDAAATVTTPLGRLGWFANPGDPTSEWIRHDISRRKRGMFDKFIATDMDRDGDMDFVGTRGNSFPYDGVFWLEQVRSAPAAPVFTRARPDDSAEMPLP